MFDQTRISFAAKLKLASSGGMVREIDVSHAQRDGGSATYMEITAPFVMKGTRFLSFDHEKGEDEHFTYVPLVRRSVQVPKWTLEQSFLGSTFFMIDIAVPDMSEFEYRFLEDAKSTDCRKIEALPQKPDYPYSRITYCIDPKTLISMTTEYFDKSGKLLKIWTPLRIEKIDGVWTPLLQTMQDVQAQAQSQLEIMEIRHHVKLSDKIFTKAHLDR